MKIFITGGTGFIGTYLVKRLSTANHELVCLARNTSNIQFLKDMGTHIVFGDVTDRSSLRNAMRGCDWVAHLASSFIFWLSNKNLFDDVNITGTKNVMEIALEMEVSKIVYVSTAAIFGNARWPITEETPIGSKRASAYVRTKYEGDKIAWNLYETKKLPLVVIYPSAVVGADDPKACGRYIRNYAQGRMPAQVLTNCCFPFVHVKDVAEAIINALEKKNNMGEKYIVSAENLTFGEFNHIVSKYSQKKLPLIKLPNWVTVFTSYLITIIANLIHKPPLWDMSIDQISLMKQGFKVDGSKAARELGITYTPISEGIKDSIESIKK